MKVCDVVLNSVWNDPRVTKQVAEYMNAKIEVACIGMKYKDFREDKIKKMPCKVTMLERNDRFGGAQKSIFKKLLREKYRIDLIKNAIITEKPDVIHANDLDALIPAYLANRKLNSKLIYDSHEINCDNRMYDKYKVYNKCMKIIEKYIVKRCWKVICVSNAAAEYFQENYGIEKPIVITNCILERDRLQNFEKKVEGFEVLNHGIFHDSRGLELMVEVCKRIEKIPEIRMAARGYGGIEESLRKQIAEEEIENFIIYPPVDPTSLISEASKSHVGVAVTLPVCLNFQLSVSNRLFEYAAAGLPVIMSDIPEHRLLNEQYRFGIVIEDNTLNSFEEAIIRLYSDKEFYRTCSENAKKMTEEITWEKQFSTLLEYLRREVG